MRATAAGACVRRASTDAGPPSRARSRRRPRASAEMPTRTRRPATTARSGSESATPRARHRAEVERARVAGNVARDHPQAIDAVGRRPAALARTRRPADGERPGAALDAHRAYEAGALAHLEREAGELLACRARRRSRDRRGSRSRARSRGVRRACAAPDRRVERERVEQLDAAAREPDLQPVGAVGGHGARRRRGRSSSP